jgi:hypothetical protein
MKILLTTFLLLMFFSDSLGQTQTATTSDGKRVILKSDGTWEYEKSKTTSKAIAETCSDYVETTTDRMTDRTSTRGRKQIVASAEGKNGIAILTLLFNDTIILGITVVGGGCIDKETSVIVLFDDDSKLTLKASNDFNCDGKATVYLRGLYEKQEALSDLANKKIKAMRVKTSKSFVEQDFKPNEASLLMSQLNCLKKVFDEKQKNSANTLIRNR